MYIHFFIMDRTEGEKNLFRLIAKIFFLVKDTKRLWDEKSAHSKEVLENGIKIHDLTLLTEEFLLCAEELVPLTQPALIIKEYRRTAIGLRSLIRRHKKYESAYWNLKKAMLFVNNFKLRHTIQRQYHANILNPLIRKV